MFAALVFVLGIELIIFSALDTSREQEVRAYHRNVEQWMTGFNKTRGDFNASVDFEVVVTATDGDGILSDRDLEDFTTPRIFPAVLCTDACAQPLADDPGIDGFGRRIAVPHYATVAMNAPRFDAPTCTTIMLANSRVSQLQRYVITFNVSNHTHEVAFAPFSRRGSTCYRAVGLCLALDGTELRDCTLHQDPVQRTTVACDAASVQFVDFRVLLMLSRDPYVLLGFASRGSWRFADPNSPHVYPAAVTLLVAGSLGCGCVCVLCWCNRRPGAYDQTLPPL